MLRFKNELDVEKCEIMCYKTKLNRKKILNFLCTEILYHKCNFIIDNLVKFWFHSYNAHHKSLHIYKDNFLAHNAFMTCISYFNRYHRVSSGNNFTNNISTKVKARCLFNSGCCRASNNSFVLFFISSSPIISLI